MQTVLIAVHLMIVIALVAVVLLQRSEGGALGMGGGGGFMSGRGQANVLTRATAILAAAFFATSLGLTLLARYGHSGKLNFNAAPIGAAEPATKLPPTQPDSILDQVRKLEQQRTTPQPGAATSAAPAPGQTAEPLPPAQPTEPSGILGAPPPSTAPSSDK